MYKLTESELLNVWEHCMDLPLLETSLHLIGAASSDADLSNIAGLSIGQRDTRLLQLREWMFGNHFTNMAVCPYCSERIEWANEISEFRLQQMHNEVSKIYTIETDGFSISYRLPTSLDLIELKQQSAPCDQYSLLDQCILKIDKNDEVYIARDLPSGILEKINNHMSLEDPQADISILLTCPACKGQWESCFDIMNYLWAEINDWASRLLQEIYLLAKNFGWCEQDILKIGSKRRKLYVAMIRA